jgi:hypothetical protein
MLLGHGVEEVTAPLEGLPHLKEGAETLRVIPAE